DMAAADRAYHLTDGKPVRKDLRANYEKAVRAGQVSQAQGVLMHWFTQDIDLPTLRANVQAEVKSFRTKSKANERQCFHPLVYKAVQAALQLK
ncbi:unnamed protein product, partial [Prorocentrum cordatum]